MSDSAALDICEIVIPYVTKTRSWARADYRIEETGRRDPGGNWKVRVIHKADEEKVMPGRGKSFVVFVDLEHRAVVKELAFQ